MTTIMNRLSFLGKMSYTAKIAICVISVIIYLTKTALMAAEIFILYALMRASFRYLRYGTMLTQHLEENQSYLMWQCYSEKCGQLWFKNL